jgi:hypothetical protein
MAVMMFVNKRRRNIAPTVTINTRICRVSEFQELTRRRIRHIPPPKYYEAQQNGPDDTENGDADYGPIRIRKGVAK